MSGRLPEVFLATAEREAQGRMCASGNRYYGAADDEVGRPIPDPDPLAVVALVAEVRRLRGLILNLGTFRRASQAETVAAFARLYGVDYVKYLGDLEAEARAIRDEQRTEKGAT